MAETTIKKNGPKFQEERLALDLLGYVIEQVEEQTPTNMHWVDTIERVGKNAWKFTIKHKSDYFPTCIKKYVSKTKKMALEGSFYSIEDELTRIVKADQRNISL